MNYKNEHIQVVSRAGKILAVQMVGKSTAPTIMFSNSLGTDHAMWQSQVAQLKQTYQIITYDTRGHGKSEVAKSTQLKDLAEDVIDILNALEIKKVHFCGISMGGLTALWLGIYQAERFHSITVANSAAKIWNEEGWNTRADDVERHGLGSLVASTHQRWFSDSFDYKHDDVAQIAIQSLKDTNPQGYADACRVLARANLQDNISVISIPTLIIAGKTDPVTTINDATFMHEHIVGSQLYLIDASHLSNVEQPECFTRALDSFIKSIQ
ncbi:alpha/beta fold hydrolase [Acinetobacter pollinis]|uniref:Alpha/beta fold hydrolase n=1 Tax=Acinetobacter pollinis TaxID=2605270 RepID=A0ABU6DS27_9GAMM|nr:alpha/beta fold hydrolase [Acinetobacter pollinis]MEB5475698.1 alpha/beta fold hydrolase [Acinetobacter pollinis]